MVVSPALPTPSVQSPQALQAGRPEVLSFGLETGEIDPFLGEMRSTSTLSEVATSSTTAAAIETTQSREPDREPSEETIPLEANVTRRRGRPKKQRILSGHSHHEKDQPTRRRDGSDSEGKGETRKSHHSGSRQGNARGKHGVIAIPLNPARRREPVRKDSTHARLQWVTNP